MLDTILQSVGHTPLVKLNRLTEGLAATVAIKVESSNPGGSVKDRVAMSMISEAERRGLLPRVAPSSKPPREIPVLGWRWLQRLKDIAASLFCPIR